MSNFINTVEADTDLNKYYAYLNAKTTSAANSTTFSEEARLEIYRVANFIEFALDGEFAVYTAFRKTKATIKICDVNKYIVESNDMLAAMLGTWEERGYTFTYTPQGLNIGIKK